MFLINNKYLFVILQYLQFRLFFLLSLLLLHLLFPLLSLFLFLFLCLNLFSRQRHQLLLLFHLFLHFLFNWFSSWLTSIWCFNWLLWFVLLLKIFPVLHSLSSRGFLFLLLFLLFCFQGLLIYLLQCFFFLLNKFLLWWLLHWFSLCFWWLWFGFLCVDCVNLHVLLCFTSFSLGLFLIGIFCLLFFITRGVAILILHLLELLFSDFEFLYFVFLSFADI